MVSKNKRDMVPLIMWLVLFVGILAVAFVRFDRLLDTSNQYPTGLDILFIGLYLVWMIIELRVTKKDVNTEGKKTNDSMSCQIYGCGQALTILTALWIPSARHLDIAVHYAGVGIFLFGACYRLWAIQTLGRFYSHRVRIVSQHKIVASGPYRITRHPAYAGMIIANGGISVYFFNWVTVCIFLFILIPAIVFRIMVEEKTLFNMAGYSSYAENRKRLFPAIW